MRDNRMKALIHSGQPALGCSLMFPSPQLVEMLGHAGFDWVLLDCEHGSLSLADVEVMAMAADAVGITAIARPRSNDAADIQSVLDRGVAGVQIPHINTAEDARRSVAAVKFGPGAEGGLAGRGMAAGTRPDRWGLGGKMADLPRRRMCSRWCVCNWSTRRRSATRRIFWRFRASMCFSSGLRIFRNPWGIPETPRRPRSRRLLPRRWR